MIDTVARIISDTDSGPATSTAKRAGNNASSMGMIGNCKPMRKLYEHIRRVAPTDTTVLVHGETGTGKELVARAIHSQSKRASKAIVCVNCAAIPETLIESEL